MKRKEKARKVELCGDISYEEAVKAVKNGDEKAKTRIAWYLLSGCDDVDVDVDQAVVLLEERVKDDDPEAMWMLGVCYEYGLGTEQNFKKAKKLYDKCFEHKYNSIGGLLAFNMNRFHPGNNAIKLERLKPNELERLISVLPLTTLDSYESMVHFLIVFCNDWFHYIFI